MQTVYKTIELKSPAKVIQFPTPALEAVRPFNYEAMELRAKRRYRRAALCDTVAAVCDIVMAIAFGAVLLLAMACLVVMF